MSIMGVAAGGLEIAYGLGQMFSASGVEKAKKGLYNTQLEGSKKRAEWNEKEILKAFTENYSNTAYAYGQKIAEITGQQAQAQSELNTSVISTISNADLADSSFYNTAKLEASDEFNEAIQTMLINQSQNLLGLSKERDAQIMQNQTELGQAMYKNQMQNIQAEQERNDQLMSGLGSVVGGMSKMESSISGNGGGSGSAKSSISNTGANASGWSGALKGSQGSRLSLTSFLGGGNGK